MKVVLIFIVGNCVTQRQGFHEVERKMGNYPMGPSKRVQMVDWKVEEVEAKMMNVIAKIC